MKPMRILIVDDDLAFRKSTKKLLENTGWSVETAASPEDALDLLRRTDFDIILSDLVMPGMSGVDLLKRLRREDPEIPLIMITGHGSIDSAVEAMKAGAADYLTKPFNPDELEFRISRALEKQRLDRRARLLEEEMASSAGRLGDMIGHGKEMEKVFRLTRRVAETETNVLILGETGTGKGLLARAIHAHSSRRNEVFVSVSCAALTPTLLESELFGHEKGAFTGATERRKGRFEIANGGTLFLDEIAELSQNLQTKLLDVVQERKFERVGGSETLEVDVRLITATNRNLMEAVREGKFREDLYYRLNVVPITLPPLRSRPEDIEALALHFLKRARENTGSQIKGIAPAAMRMLLDYPWPGNVRELENTIERAVVLAEGEYVEEFEFEKHAAPEETPVSTERPLKDIIKEQTELVEKQYLKELLRRFGGNVSKSSEHAGIDRRTLFEKMKQYGLRKEDYK